MITLRPYQEKAVTLGMNSFEEGKNSIIQIPTGGGKSLIISEICHRLNEPTLILQPSVEILQQNYAKLKLYGIKDIGVFSASAGRKELGNKYLYATIGSIYKKPELFDYFKYFIIDECHLVNPATFTKKAGSMYAKFFSKIKDVKVLGLTATPYRLVQEYRQRNGFLFYETYLKIITDIKPGFFKNFAYIVNNSYMFNKGYLCPIEYVIPEQYVFDLNTVRKNSNGTDFKEEDLIKVVESDYSIKKLISSILEYGNDRPRNLVFCTSVRQAVKACAILNKMGIPSAYVYANMNMNDRERNIEMFRKGEIKHMFNVNVLSIGFDLPELDCITLARPTLSVTLYYQQVGRGVRLDPNNSNKKLRVIDISKNSERIGKVENIRLVAERVNGEVVYLLQAGDKILNNKTLSSFLVKKTNKINIALSKIKNF